MKKAFFTLLSLFFLIGCNIKVENTPIPLTDSFPLSQADINDFEKLTTPMTQQEPLLLADKDLAYFDNLRTAPIIGLGEATHGTKEFFQMKHRLFKYFVEHFNHKIFAFEMDFSEALIFDEYIQTGKGDIVEMIKNDMYFWTWSTSEVKDLFVWMKDYNLGKAPKDKIHLYGIDCQTFIYNIPELRKRLSKLDSKVSTKVDSLLSTNSITGFLKNNDNVFLKINNIIKENRSALVDKSSEDEYKFIEQISNILIQTYLYNIGINEPTNSTLRDKYMAENLVWVKSLTDFPISVWAHNAHVQNTDGSTVIGRAMGYFTNNILQGGYKSIGFTFSYGTTTNWNYDENKYVVMNITPDDTKEYSNELFGKIKTPNYFFKPSEVYRNVNLKNYLTKTPFLYTGGRYFVQDPLYKKGTFWPIIESNFDYIINISKMTNSDCYKLSK